MNGANFFVAGHPKPQGSKRAFVNKATGRVNMVESSAGVGDWRGDVRAAAMERWGDHPPLEGPVTVLVVFHLPRPKSHPKTKETWPTTRPDTDKLLRAVLDALTGVAFKDDSQVTVLTGVKAWDLDHPLGRTGAQIKVAGV